MKKILFLLGLVATMGICSAYPSEKVSPRVLSSFKSEFSNAQNVEWETGANYFRAAFSLNEQRIFAYYNPEGELVSIARYMSSLQLPINLYNTLKKEYDKYWISDLFEVSNSEGMHYYVILETANSKLTIRSTNGGSWTTYSKSKKI
jgi:hypothetical protein